LSEAAKPSLRMPSSFSVSVEKPMKPQTLPSGFSRRAKVGRRISCSTLPCRSSGATRNRLISRFGCRQQIAHAQQPGVDGRRAFNLERGDDGVAFEPEHVISSMVRLVASLNWVGSSETMRAIRQRGAVPLARPVVAGNPYVEAHLGAQAQQVILDFRVACHRGFFVRFTSRRRALPPAPVR